MVSSTDTVPMPSVMDGRREISPRSSLRQPLQLPTSTRPCSPRPWSATSPCARNAPHTLTGATVHSGKSSHRSRLKPPNVACPSSSCRLRRPSLEDQLLPEARPHGPRFSQLDARQRSVHWQRPEGSVL